MAEVTEKNVLENPFFNKVLRSVRENNRTAEEVHKKYVDLFPPRFYGIRKRLGLSVSVKQVEFALSQLSEVGLVKKTLTWYTDRPLDCETVVYCISNKGRLVLLGKKKS